MEKERRVYESEIEKMLVDEVRKAGGRAYKFVSPGNDGVPDRIVIMPGGYLMFVELKTDTGRLSKLQTVQINRLKNLGVPVKVAYGYAGLEELFLILSMSDAADRARRRAEREAGA